jgi:hypothetical protein
MKRVRRIITYNGTFPLFSWYVAESDNTRFKNTGVHVVYDFGIPLKYRYSTVSPVKCTTPTAIFT